MPTPNPAIARPSTRPATPGVTAKITLPTVQRRAARVTVRTIVRRSAISGVSTVPGTENPSSSVPESRPIVGRDMSKSPLSPPTTAPTLPEHTGGAQRDQKDSKALAASAAPVGRLNWLASTRSGRHGAIIPGLAPSRLRSASRLYRSASYTFARSIAA